MTLKNIGRMQFYLAALYSIPCLPLSILFALVTFGIALIVLIPLWWTGIALMRAQYRAQNDAGSRVWWWSLAYHAVALVSWSICIGGDLFTPGELSDPLLMLFFLGSPVLGTGLSIAAVVIARNQARVGRAMA